MNPGVGLEQLEKFAKRIASIGDITIGGNNDGYAEVDIFPEILFTCDSDPITTTVESIFPTFLDGNYDVRSSESRAIIAPTLDVVNAINEFMNDNNTMERKTYLSYNTVCQSDSSNDILAYVHTPEFLNGIQAFGLPNHSLTLKVGSPIMLLRNIDHTLGSCNGIRLVITKLSDNVIKGSIMTSVNAGTKVLVARMPMTPSYPKLSFKLQRRQFPWMLSYAMTINKSQGQTLTHVGLLLKKSVFVHGQLYVAASRVSDPNGIKILSCDEDGNIRKSTTNVVYKEVFNNL